MSVQSRSHNSNEVNDAERKLAAQDGVAQHSELNVPPRPLWFKPKSKKGDHATSKIVVSQEIQHAQENPRRGLLLLLLGMIMHPVQYIPQLSGLGISFLVHGLFLVVLALFTFSTGAFKQGELTLISGDGGEDMAVTRIDTSVAMDVNPSQMMETSISMPVAESSEIAEINDNNKTMESIDASVFERLESASNPFKGAFAPPAGSKVVTQGSFAAYTVPNDPVPEQTYYVIILIKVPKGMDKYPVSDLTGNIIGTDGWEQPIVDKVFLQRNKYLEVKDDVAQLVVQVPGAYKLVRDKIAIRSKILKENQRLEIEF